MERPRIELGVRQNPRWVYLPSKPFTPLVVVSRRPIRQPDTPDESRVLCSVRLVFSCAGDRGHLAKCAPNQPSALTPVLTWPSTPQKCATLLGGQERGILRTPTSSGQVGGQTFSAKKQGQPLRQQQWRTWKTSLRQFQPSPFPTRDLSCHPCAHTRAR